MAKTDDLDKLVTDAREAGLGVDDRPLGNRYVRITPDPGEADVDYYEIDDEGNVAHHGPHGEFLGTVTLKALRGELELD